MRASARYGAKDTRIENLFDARLIQPTDALVAAVRRACICGSNLWLYNPTDLIALNPRDTEAALWGRRSCWKNRSSSHSSVALIHFWSEG